MAEREKKPLPVPVQNPVTIMDLKAMPWMLIVKIEKCLLFPIVRTQADSNKNIMDVIVREQASNQLDVCINALWYGVTYAGKVAYVGSGGGLVDVAEIKNEGQLLLTTGAIHGKPSPLGYYGAQRKDDEASWEFGFGDLNLSKGFRAGVSGLCPLIIDGLKYGTGNEYNKSLPSNAPQRDVPIFDEPALRYKQFLVQRNSKKYTALDGSDDKDGRLGKAGFGVTKDGTCFVIVQKDLREGPFRKGVSLDVFRNLFIRLGCHNALACDGSDSVIMYRRKPDGTLAFDSTPGTGKRQTMTTALGFKSGKQKEYNDYLQQRKLIEAENQKIDAENRKKDDR